MKLYERMNQGENLSWCKPITNSDLSMIVVVNEGEVVSFQVTHPLPEKDWGAPESMDVDELIEKYKLHRELGCPACPFRDECDAMIIRND